MNPLLGPDPGSEVTQIPNIKRSVLHRFGDVFGQHLFAPAQVGDGALRTFLGNWDKEKPAMLERNVITFVGTEGKEEFLAVLRGEIASDDAWKVRTVGPHLLAKLEKL